MKSLLLLACLITFGLAERVWITLSDSTLQQLHRISNVTDSKSQLPVRSQNIGHETIYIIQIDDSTLTALSEVRHREHLHGPGFVVHNSFGEAVLTLQSLKTMSLQPAVEYPPIKGDPKIKEWLTQASASNVAETIIRLSTDFKNRHYKSDYGAAASKWILEKWRAFASSRKDVTVEQFTHTWKQPSVILTIPGSDPKAGTVVVGGHMDSTTGSSDPETMVAPGADDNASGTASLTEALRVLLANDFKPRQTVKFMAYAAEEAGLLGSKDIVEKIKSANTKITGAMQLDMTNYKGGISDIYLVTDYTNAEQNQYLIDLAKEYLPELEIGKMICGYACSDHASWHQNGYRASFPHETNTGNKNAHTVGDIIQNADPTGGHALKFAKLALIFAAELGNAADLE